MGKIGAAIGPSIVTTLNPSGLFGSASEVVDDTPTYYVSNTGSDGDLGTSPGEAWETVAKVNSTTLVPGDIVAFNKGDVWRETLTIPDSGTSENYIEFTSYGTGNEPRIYGSELGTTWTNTTGDVWEATETLLDPYSFADRIRI